MKSREYFRDFYYNFMTPKAVKIINEYGPYDRALYIECDNGRLIEFIAANEIHGMDNSEIESVPIVKRIDAPDKVYDLIVISEKDYSTYSKDQIYEWVRKSSARIIVVIGTRHYMKEYDFGNILAGEELIEDIIIRVYSFTECNRVYDEEVWTEIPNMTKQFWWRF